MKSLAIELFKDENSKPYSFKSKAMDRVYLYGNTRRIYHIQTSWRRNQANT